MWIFPLLGLVVWLMMSGRGTLSLIAGANINPLFYALATAIVSLDLLDLLIRVWVTRHSRFGNKPSTTSIDLDVGTFTPHQMRLHTKPFVFVTSVRNASDELDDFLEDFEMYRDRLYIIDDASDDETFARLKRAGVRAVRSPDNLKKPGAIRRLLLELPPSVATVIVLDPDIRILGDDGRIPDFERVIFDFQRSGFAAVTPNVVVRPGNWLTRLQGLEYCLALGLGRRSLADRSITSGVSIYRRDALERALEGHSLSVYAEDLRNALILLGRGEKIYYDSRFLIETTAKSTWPSWFSQRVGWHYGLIKVYIENFKDVLKASKGRPFFAYQFLLYLGFFGLVLQPLRLASVFVLLGSMLNGAEALLGLDIVPNTAATAPALFLFGYLQFTALAVAASGFAAGSFREWLGHQLVVPLYFFYAIAYVIPASIGYLNWISMRLAGRRIYRDHFHDEERQATLDPHPAGRT